jgi:hypothetical protein
MAAGVLPLPISWIDSVPGRLQLAVSIAKENSSYLTEPVQLAPQKELK